MNGVAVVAVVAVAAAFLLVKRRKRRLQTQCPQLGKENLVRLLPQNTKFHLSGAFMVWSENKVNVGVYYHVWADKLGFSKEDLQHLHLLRQNTRRQEFCNKFFDLVDKHKPEMTIGEMSKIIVDCGRGDLIRDMIKWAKEEGVELQIPESEFTTDNETQLQSILNNSTDPLLNNGNRSSSPVPPSPPSQRCIALEENVSTGVEL
jgi:hypothetical protein